MVRRSFRLGLRLGLLAGIAIAVAKALQSRRGQDTLSSAPSPWPPSTPAKPHGDQVVDTTQVPKATAPTTTSPAATPAPARDATPAPAKGLTAPPPAPAQAPAAKKAPATKKASKATKAVEGQAQSEATSAAVSAGGATAAWVKPSGGVCPDTHPVKAKMTSKLFHLPGMFAYARTNPDRCYKDEDAAVEDGLTKAKR
jgi:hypothetical protein